MQFVASAMAHMADDARRCHMNPIFSFLGSLVPGAGLLQQLDDIERNCSGSTARRTLLRRQAASNAARALRGQSSLLAAFKVLWHAVSVLLGGKARAPHLGDARNAPVYLNDDGEKVPADTPGARVVTGQQYGCELAVAECDFSLTLQGACTLRGACQLRFA